MPVVTDFTKYPGASVDAVHIGWLGRRWFGRNFTEGETTEVFRKALAELCCKPVRLCMGHHECLFCGNSPAVEGNGEVFVMDRAGQVYVAPAMISHYVEQHHYKPPDAFVAAVLNPADTSLNGLGSEW